jgi:hypothetical protein
MPYLDQNTPGNSKKNRPAGFAEVEKNRHSSRSIMFIIRGSIAFVWPGANCGIPSVSAINQS